MEPGARVTQPTPSSRRLARILGHFEARVPRSSSEGGVDSKANARLLSDVSTSAPLPSLFRRPHPMVSLTNEVATALRRNEPVVALESTIISHGMPYPQNVETARRVEETVRKHGGVPATVAILEGKIHVGLTTEQLEKLGKLGTKCHKCSRRDLALIVAQKGNGATTVAATMYIASLAGIRVFVTGGIGGAHRGVEKTLDISADLTELARTNVAVVCAGAKSILDIPKTLEVLETAGVPVIGFGVSEFPAFFSRNSGSQAPLQINSEREVASFLHASDKLSIQGGAVIAVPIPMDQAGNASRIGEATKKALAETIEKKIEGRNITPYLLERINQLTEGHSLSANINLVLNNAKVGTRIAVELSKLRRQAQ